MKANVTLVSLIDNHPTYTLEVRSNDVSPVRIILYRFSAFRDLYYDINGKDFVPAKFPVTHKRQSLGFSLTPELLEQRCLQLDKWMISLINVFETLSPSIKAKVLDFLHLSSDIIEGSAGHDLDDDASTHSNLSTPLHFHSKSGSSRPVYSFNHSHSYSQQPPSSTTPSSSSTTTPPSSANTTSSSSDHHNHHHHSQGGDSAHGGNHHHGDEEKLPGTLYQGELRCTEFNMTVLGHGKAKEYLMQGNTSNKRGNASSSSHGNGGGGGGGGYTSYSNSGPRVYIVLSYLAIHIFRPLESKSSLKQKSEYQSISGLNIRNNVKKGLKRFTSFNSDISTHEKNKSPLSSSSSPLSPSTTTTNNTTASHGRTISSASGISERSSSIFSSRSDMSNPDDDEEEDDEDDGLDGDRSYHDVKQGEFIVSISLSDIISVHKSIEGGGSGGHDENNDRTCVFTLQDVGFGMATFSVPTPDHCAQWVCAIRDARNRFLEVGVVV
jgi:hypothetical protein